MTRRFTLHTSAHVMPDAKSSTMHAQLFAGLDANPVMHAPTHAIPDANPSTLHALLFGREARRRG